MKKQALFGVVILGLVAVSAPAGQKVEPPRVRIVSPVCFWKCSNKGVECFEKNYADFASKIKSAALVWDDGIEKTFEQKLENPDLEDQLSIIYPKGRRYQTPDVNSDPGRIRVESFFKIYYGNTAAEVKKNLVPVNWMPRHTNRKIVFNKNNGAAKALKKVSRELDDLPDELLKYVTKTSGTFKWRKIAGTNRLSAHSFAIAIDINIEYSDYWRWAKQPEGKKIAYKNQIPIEIVEIFEKHGFIWGGKWYHYDTMHFEYRPELLCD